MLWAILALVGVPLWLCALGILVVAFRNRRLRKRHGDIPVRVLRPGKTRWVPGHALWISDVFAWRGNPAAWNEELTRIVAASVRSAEPEELKAVHRLGDRPAVAELTADDGRVHRVAAASGHRRALTGPFSTAAQP
jgi:hypothetical protein